MRPSTFFVPLLCALTLAGCDVEPMTSSDAPDDEYRDGSPFSAEELYVQLRDLSDEYPLPQPTDVIEMGTFDPATGEFDGLQSTDSYYDYELGTFIPEIPAAAAIQGVRAILRFRVSNGASMTVRVDGTPHFKPSGSDYIDIDVGHATDLDFSISGGGHTHADQLVIARNGIDGLGAFEVEAWPIGLLYEPPTNEAATNAASFTHVTQRSASTSIGRTEETSRFVEVPSMVNRVHALADKAPQSHPIGVFVSHIDDLVGTIHSKVTDGSSVSNQSTLEISTSEMLSVTTNADLGPGRGDVIAYLRNPRLAWVMVDGQVTVTLIDYAGAEYRSASQLRADLLAVRNGGTASHTGLSQTSLEGLLGLDPFFEGEDANMPSSRFELVDTISVGGADVSVALSHTRTSSDTTTRSSFTGRIVQTQAGWLSAIGIGIGSTGQQTTRVTQSSSRASSVGETVTSTFQLGAGPTESYTVQAYYDRIFGTFALRRPDACPFFDPLHRDGSFCNDPACPCEDGAGDCDNDDQCADGLFCGQDIGAQFGLPATWDVCVDEITCPPFNPDLPNGSFCTAECPCSSGEGDCDADNECAGSLVCAQDVGANYGLPPLWDMCQSPFVVPVQPIPVQPLYPW